MGLEVYQFACLSDNYGYLIRDDATEKVAAIDTPDVTAINQALAQKKWTLTDIFNTHHHYDHAGGNLALKEQWQCIITGPRAEAARIPGIDRQVGDGDVVELGDSKANVFDTPGHTAGHIVYHFEQDGAAFVGDTIFALGCGRLFEGTPQQMWTSLSKVAQWPAETLIYCAHEYTQANAKFALSVDGQNPDLLQRNEEINALRADGKPTVPTTVALELSTNPFLRPDAPGVRAGVDMPDAEIVDVFAEVRRRKDNF